MIRLSDSSAIASVNAVVDQLDAGGSVELYTGSMPALPSDPITTQVLLATFTLPAPAYGAAVIPVDYDGARAVGAAIPAATPVATGTATWARVKDSGGNPVFDGNVGLVGSTAFVRLSTTTVQAGIDISVVLSQYNQPRA